MPRAAAFAAAQRLAHAVQAPLQFARATTPDQFRTAAIVEPMGVNFGALVCPFPSRDVLWTEAVSWTTGEFVGRCCHPLRQVAALMAS